MIIKLIGIAWFFFACRWSYAPPEDWQFFICLFVIIFVDRCNDRLREINETLKRIEDE